MSDFSWLSTIEDLSPAALTVRAQVIDPLNIDELLYTPFFPRSDVDSVDLKEMRVTNFRPVGDRREWNQRGRFIPRLTPAQLEMSMVPIETFDKIEEYEMQKLLERSLGGNVEQVRTILRASIPNRVDDLAMADLRRLNVDSFNAWATGQIVQKNPQTGQTFTASFGFAAGRYQTAGTVWGDASVNAYNNFISWVQDGFRAVGSATGAVMSLARFLEIQADAPQGYQLMPLTAAQVRDRVQQDLGFQFTIYIIENTADVFTDGGIAYLPTRIWPADRIALVPAGQAVGVAAHAPVARAMELAQQVPGAGIDIRGTTIYYDARNAGRDLTIECQLNAMPVPDETRMWVIDVA